MNNILLTLLTIVIPLQSDEWELAIDEDGVQVYTQVMEGSQIKKFLARTQVTASTEAVLEVLQNFEDYKNWIDKCKSAELIEKEDDWSSYIYTVIAVPFSQDRDLVQKLKITPISNGYSIEVICVPDHIPEVDRLIRMFSAGSWKIIAMDDGLTQIEMEFHNDPMGIIPAWVINTQIVKSPHKTLKSLKANLEKIK